MNGEVVVALDAGGSYVKATLFDPETGTHESFRQEVDLLRLSPGFTERGSETLWQAAADCLAALMQQLSGGASRVAAVCITGHGNGLYLCNDEGLPTTNSIMAADGRAGPLVKRWAEEGVEELVREHSWNGLWAGKPGPLLAWLMQNDPDRLADSEAALSCKDYLRARLTGVVATEVSDATAGGLYDNSVLTAKPRSSLHASQQTLRALGIEQLSHLLRSSVASDSLYEVSLAGAAATGLLPGTPVVAGLVDNSATQHGSGLFDSSAICVGAGTWSINQVLVPLEQMTLDQALGIVRPYAANLGLGNRALLCEASATSASNFAWALERILTGTSSADRAAGCDVFEARLEREGLRRKRADDPMFMPFIDGSRDEAAARGAWLGLSSAATEDDLLGAVLEGICFEHRRHVERLERPLGDALPIRLSGGASKSAVWSQLFADVLGRPVEVSPVAELGSVCAAALAGVSAGLFGSVREGVEWLNPDWRVFEPRTADADLIDERWKTYQTWAERLGKTAWGNRA